MTGSADPDRCGFLYFFSSVAEYLFVHQVPKWSEMIPSGWSILTTVALVQSAQMDRKKSVPRVRLNETDANDRRGGSR